MREFFRRRFDYTTRYHMMRRARSFDYRFTLALLALAGAAIVAIRIL